MGICKQNVKRQNTEAIYWSQPQRLGNGQNFCARLVKMYSLPIFCFAVQEIFQFSLRLVFLIKTFFLHFSINAIVF